jgi:hypothetical protein
MKNKKHKKIVKDYDRTKEDHLEKLASKMLDYQDKLRMLKEKDIKGKFLDLF